MKVMHAFRSACLCFKYGREIGHVYLTAAWQQALVTLGEGTALEEVHFAAIGAAATDDGHTHAHYSSVRGSDRLLGQDNFMTLWSG